MRKQKTRNLFLVLAAGAMLCTVACMETQKQELPLKPIMVSAASATPAGTMSSTPEPTRNVGNTGNLPEPTKQEELTESPVPTESPVSTESPVPTESPAPTVKPTPTPVLGPTEGEVVFSESGYFFDDTVTIELSIESGKAGYITYTLDGSEPTEDGTRYTEPLVLEESDEISPRLYSLRIKAWYEDGSCSDTYVHTYFVGAGVKERYSTMIFSINGDPAELTEEPDGILYGENYKQKGRESERKVSIEAVSADGSLIFSQFAGVRVFGGSSREFPIKSLKLFARKEYQEGMGSFKTSVFGSLTVDGTKAVKKYDKLVLRNGGDDFQSGFIRDELAQELAGEAGFAAYEAVVPAVAYINGSYYGFYWLHESYCDKYFQNRNGKSAGEYVVLEGSDKYKSLKEDELENAAAKEYNRMYKKYSEADLTDDSIYAEVCAWMDVENYLDYMAFNMYISNYDWPQGNYRCFRYYAAEGEEYGEGEKDGRWRFLLHDADVGFATYSTAKEAASRNDIKAVLTSSNKRYSALLANLLKREDCRRYFINKMLEYRDGALSYETVCTVLEEMCAKRDTELEYYFDYLDELKETTEDIWATKANTQAQIEKIKEFARLRGDYITRYLEEFFDM